MTLGVNLFLCLMLVPGLGLNSARASVQAEYSVVSGDNLTFIAKRFGISLSSLRRSNPGISDLLAIGQKLQIEAPFSDQQPGSIQWRQPCHQAGRVLRPFGNYKAKNILMTRTGVDLACPLKSPIKAPAASVVRHIGILEGFGTVLILEHAHGFASVYSPLNAKTLKVKVGQALNPDHLLGFTAAPELENSVPYLHLELRLNQTAIDPQPLHR